MESPTPSCELPGCDSRALRPELNTSFLLTATVLAVVVSVLLARPSRRAALISCLCLGGVALLVSRLSS